METQSEEVNATNILQDNAKTEHKVSKKTNINLLTIISIGLNIIVIGAMVAIITYSQNKIAIVEDSVTVFNNNMQSELNKISDVEIKVSDIKTKVDGFDERIIDVAVKNLQLDLDMKRYEKASFDLSDAKGYGRIDSSGGLFFITIENVEKYLDGYKINLRIGNPQNCTYRGFELKTEWNKPFTVEMDYDEWSKNKKEKTISMNEELSSGSWAECSINLAPMTEEEIHNVGFSIITDSLSLYTK